MIDWIVNNKEWLFSGVGIAIVAGIVGFLFKKPHRKKISKKTAKSKSGNDTYKYRPLPNEIHEDIQNRPELQKKEACKYYIGLKVRWQLMIRSITDIKGGMIQVTFYDPKNIMLDVACEVKLDEYPELKIVKQKHKAWIKGEIKGVHEWHIDLCDVSIEFDEL